MTAFLLTSLHYHMVVVFIFRSKAQIIMETRIGSLIFTSKFDSGNLARVEKVAKDDDEDVSNSSKICMILSFYIQSYLFLKM